ncbi:hypothetical protein, partial [Streptomyces sp. NPDC055080]
RASSGSPSSTRTTEPPPAHRAVPVRPSLLRLTEQYPYDRASSGSPASPSLFRLTQLHPHQ